MSLVLALKNEESVFMASDSAGFDQDSLELMLRKDEKVFWVGQFLIGCVGSFRMNQVLRFQCDELLELQPKGDGLEFMVREFIPIVRKAVSELGVVRIVDNQEWTDPFIVAWGNQYFVIDSDLHVANPASDFYGIGCAGSVAMGALFALQHFEDQADTTAVMRMLALSCTAAQNFSVGIRPPYTVISTAGDYRQFQGI